MASWLFTPSPFDLLVDKATSPLIPIGTHDLATNFDVADSVRSKTVQPKPAAQTLKRKLQDRNPNVQLLALRLLDSCIKNGGDHFLAEIGTKEHVDVLASLMRSSPNHDVKNLALDLYQQWALTFASKDEFAYLVETYNTLKTSGVTFPPPPPVSLSLSASAFTSTSTLPAWSDSTVCQRCRTPFSFTNRKHHCRNCGRVFDQQCSAHTLALPWYGVADEVRVCDGCWHKKAKVKVDTPPPSTSKPGPTVPGKKELRKGQAGGREESDLARAIALSLAEANNAGTGGGSRGFVQAPTYGSEPPLVDGSGVGRRATSAVDRSAADEEEDDDLRAAIEASLREMSSAPSAPPPLDGAASDIGEGDDAPVAPRPWELPSNEEDAVLTFAQTVELAGRAGGDLRRFPGVDALEANARGVADGRVRGGMADVDNRQRMLYDMQAKLTEAVGLYDRLQTERVALADRQRHDEAQRRLAFLQQQQQQQQAYNPYAQQPAAWAQDSYAQPPPQASPYGQPAYGAAFPHGPPPTMHQQWSSYHQPAPPQQLQQPTTAQDVYPQMPPVEAAYVNDHGQHLYHHQDQQQHPAQEAGPSSRYWPQQQSPQEQQQPPQQQQQQPPQQQQQQQQQQQPQQAPISHPPEPEQQQPSYPVQPYPDVISPSASSAPPPPSEDNVWASSSAPSASAAPQSVSPSAAAEGGQIYPALHAGQPLYSPSVSPVDKQHSHHRQAWPTPTTSAPAAAFPTAPLTQPLASGFPSVPDAPIDQPRKEEPPAKEEEAAPLISF